MCGNNRLKGSHTLSFVGISIGQQNLEMHVQNHKGNQHLLAKQQEPWILRIILILFYLITEHSNSTQKTTLLYIRPCRPCLHSPSNVRRTACANMHCSLCGWCRGKNICMCICTHIHVYRIQLPVCTQYFTLDSPKLKRTYSNQRKSCSYSSELEHSYKQIQLLRYVQIKKLLSILICTFQLHSSKCFLFWVT